MRTNEYYIVRNGTLYHHGIKGQKWGLRRFQNEDGTYTPEGRIRYGRVGKIAKAIAPKTYNAFKKYKSLKNLNYKGATVTAGVRTASGLIDDYSRQKTLAILGGLAGGAYLLSGSDPYVKKGLMTVGVITNTVLTAKSIDLYVSQGVSTVKDFMKAAENFNKNRNQKKK